MRCKDCKYCVNTGRAESQCEKIGRKYYYCRHEKANKEVNAFVSFGEGCSFGECCSFGEYCSFGEWCSFGERCSFGEWCSFGEGCNLNNKSKFENLEEVVKEVLKIDRIGSRKGCTYFFKTETNIYVRCGCFSGDIIKFEDEVNETHKENKQYLKEYKGAINYAKLVLNNDVEEVVENE